MKRQITRQQIALIAGTLLVFPAVYFISAALLYYNWGFSALWKLIEPIFENPANKRFGWNINLLILFGPMLALILNALSVLQVRWINLNEVLQLNFSIRKHWLNISVALVSMLVLTSLFAYLIGENCRG